MNSKHEVNCKVQVNENGLLKPIIKFRGSGGCARLRRGRDRVLRRWARELPRKPPRRGPPGGSAFRPPWAWPWRRNSPGGQASPLPGRERRDCGRVLTTVMQVFSSETGGRHLKHWKWRGPWKMAVWRGVWQDCKRWPCTQREVSGRSPRRNPFRDQTSHSYSNVSAAGGSFLFIWSPHLYRQRSGCTWKMGSRDHSSSPILRRFVFIHLLLQFTKLIAW